MSSYFTLVGTLSAVVPIFFPVKRRVRICLNPYVFARIMIRVSYSLVFSTAVARLVKWSEES